MVQLHAVAAGLPVVRPTNDVDVLLHVEKERGRASQVAAALEQLGYRLRPSIDARAGTAHRFVRDGAVVDLVTSGLEPSVVDMVAADHDVRADWKSPDRRGRRSMCPTRSAR